MRPARPLAVCAVSDHPLEVTADLAGRLDLTRSQVDHASGRGWHLLRVTGAPLDPVSSDEFPVLAARLRRRMLALHPQADVLVVPPALVAARPGLVVTDVDSTLITGEVIDELARCAGTHEEVARITAQAMNGEMDFEESLRRRVRALAGVPSTVFAHVLQTIRPTAGAQALIDSVHAAGGEFGVVSGGFDEVVAPLAERMGIDHHRANRLEVRSGVLTGRVLGEVVTADVKVRELRHWAGARGVPLSRTVAIGDGANDVPMLGEAGLGLAFRPKPAVRARVPDALSLPALDVVAHVLAPRS